MAEIVWSNFVRDVLEELPTEESDLIEEKVEMLARFHRMYPVRIRGRFRRHRRLLAGRWIVFYRIVDETVCIRGLWPAQIP